MRGYDQPKGLQATEIFGLQVPMTANDRTAFAGHDARTIKPRGGPAARKQLASGHDTSRLSLYLRPDSAAEGKPDGSVVGWNRRD